MNKTELLKLVSDAYDHACEKHPFFAHVPVQDFHSQFETSSKLTYARIELREQIKLGHVQGLSVLVCEMLEAVDAYTQGNKPNCIIELAQCAAVILRMIERVDEESKS